MAHFDFDGIENANVFERGAYLPPGGKYLLSIVRILTKQTRQSGPAFIAEFEVLESDHDEVPVGAKRSWFQKLQDTDVAFPALLEFFGALYGYDPTNKEELAELKSKIKGIIKLATSYEGPAAGHPCHGQKIKCETWQKETKKGNDFTVHSWGIVEDDED